MIAITGNTYPVKDRLKALGARWNPGLKAWMISEDRAEQARQIVSAAPASTSAPRPYHATNCKVCGISEGPRVRIYRSGECQDCFEERKMGY